MLKSAVIEEKKFKHSAWEGADKPLGPKFWCQHEGLITVFIWCKFKKNLFNLWLYTHLFINNPRGQNFDVNRNLLSLRSSASSLKKNLFEVWFYANFFHDFIHVYSPGQVLTTPWGRNFYINRNILSLWSYVASFKKIALKSDFIQLFFSWFYTCI